MGVDAVPPHVLHAFVARPQPLARDRARLTAEALVQVQHHRQLSLNLCHAYLLALGGLAGLSSISWTYRTFILRSPRQAADS
jgi:hypothetical protein